MNIVTQKGDKMANAERKPRRSPLLITLVALLFAECALVVVAVVYLVIELLVDIPTSYASAVAILVLAIAAAIGIGVAAVHLLRGNSWARGAALVWQILQMSIGVGSLQGASARPDVGWLLIIPALAVLVLLFTRPVLEATTRRG